jgi:predicted MPP superfamily phosphohydrolase
MIAELSALLLAPGGLGTLTGLSLAGLYAVTVEPTWLKIARLRLGVRNLPAEFEGFTIAQLSDLHYSAIVKLDYLRTAVRRTNAAAPDLIALTGDYITRGEQWIDGVADAVSELRAPAGVFAVLGNHDYHGEGAEPWRNDRIAGRIAAAFTAGGLTVLRNQSVEIRRGGRTLQLVGLDDLWSRRFDPDAAFADVRRDRPTVALSHNPDTFDALAARGADLVLSGHTHGGQINLPVCGPPIRACRNRKLTWGHYRFGPSHLYINPGIGYLQKVRFGCRPEISLITLEAA